MPVVMTLLDAGAVQRDRALWMASFGGYTPIAKLLIDRGANVDYDMDEWDDVDGMETTPLIAACISGVELALLTLLLDHGANIEVRAFGTALYEAAFFGRLEHARLLLDRGADIHAWDMNGDHDTALRSAAMRGHLEMVRLLLDSGAHVHAGNEDALRQARKHNHHDVAALLLERGAHEPDPEQEGVGEQAQ